MGPPEPSAALKLLAACAVLPSEAASVPVRTLAAQITDWIGFVALANRHEVSGLVHVALRSAGVAVPEPAAGALVRRTARIRKRALKIIAEAAATTRILRAAGIEARAIKGPALAKLAFDDATVRRAGDLDLLVERARMPAARAALLAQGYRQTNPLSADLDDSALLERYLDYRKDITLERPGSIAVELHCRLTDNDRLYRLAPDSPSETVELAPGVEVDTLSGDELILYLCVHGALNAWNCLKWLADIAALLAGKSEAEIAALVDLARSRGLERPLGQALLLLDWLGMIAHDPALCDRLARDRPTRWLFALGRRALTEPRQSERNPLRYVLPVGSALLWRRGWRARGAFVWALLVDGERVAARGGSRGAVLLTLAERPFRRLRRGAR